ncbi:hypothetical protein FRB99_006979 [Tulasnella sp. 403]|nr:hypothetical protein FRB99_006979 [Tulasnella sp. 403]
MGSMKVETFFNLGEGCVDHMESRDDKQEEIDLPPGSDRPPWLSFHYHRHERKRKTPMDPEDQVTRPLLAPSTEDIASTKVFPLIHRIKRDTIKNIDTALSWDQLTAPDVNFTVVKPLVATYSRLHNKAVVHAFLVVRSHFISTAEDDLAFASLCLSRAAFCELMAIKMLREFSNFDLVVVCTTPWNSLQGASDEVIRAIKAEVGEDEDLEEPLSALEVSIMTESKHFLSSPLVQEVINEIWSGRVMFSATSSHSLLADNYKSRPIATYHNPKTSPFLDHYRLRVPKYRYVIELLNFSILLILFWLCLANKNFATFEWTEIIFCVFAFGFMLDEFVSSQEHGWRVYVANMWNGFDLSFLVLFLVYFILRMRGYVTKNDYLNDLAFDILSCGACILFPRVAFFFISNNVVIVYVLSDPSLPFVSTFMLSVTTRALRAMMVQFALFIGVAATCFSGLLFTLWKLSGPEWTLKKIAWLMVQIWFGNTYLSFSVAESFHPIFGPPLMVLFAALSNTLLITILISILSATYAKVDAHATEEYLFQSAISTLEGVKTDALFSYQSPFNLAAYVILAPLSFILSPRMLHTVNVFLIRLTGLTTLTKSIHILASITIYERWFAPGSKFMESGKDTVYALYESLPKRIKNVSVLEAMVGASSHDLLDAIFDVELPDELLDDLDSVAPVVPSPRLGVLETEETRPGRPASIATGIQTPRGRYNVSLPNSPGYRSRSAARGSAYLAPIDVNSPLARLFGGSKGDVSPLVQEDIASSMKRLEGLLEGLPDAQKVRGELKDTRERLERIEMLLLTLTKGSRS